MVDSFNSIKFPELFVGFVAPIGADVAPIIKEFRIYFEEKKYKVIDIKVTDVFNVMKNYIIPEMDLKKSPLVDRYNSYINYGNQLREHFDDNSILSKLTIQIIVKKRIRQKYNSEFDKFQKTVYFINQFKRKEEIELFRSVYGRLFFQVSLYSRRGARVDYLSRKFASSENSAGSNRFRYQAEKLIQNDENEVAKSHGQRVAKIFHDADLIINLDVELSVKRQVFRFCELLFGSNAISPTRIEYGMFLAKAAALRTLDLSRQVGAAIFSGTGEVLSLGSNEVPKALGGTYWSDEGVDDREFIRGHDSNDQRKREILVEILNIISPDCDIDKIISSKEIQDSQFMDALEYGRIVHAEMSAISDAARVGSSIRGGTLYCTTFPCHMCAKHIVASGVTNVIFLEPYPKSLAYDLHSDSIHIEGNDRGHYQQYPSVRFEHFYGVSPRRYREIFERNKRKNDNGSFRPYINDNPSPIIDIKIPFYTYLEESALEILGMQFDVAKIDDELDALDAEVDE
ncbi:deoxycytidylate deaminase [Ancylobacter sp. 3268]|uniref:anti-phage dCTP deaminase n=1 Tax=Ancylobacter sp. 3268 TaxID=2817752 RepID=UPI002854BEDD|nr:anti-phage dCTP deaminase [Ancylobacter sp. 3268]MDR6955237.1 deoxycytidylate deaminase [Ancylobacter sp. 3268]